MLARLLARVFRRRPAPTAPTTAAPDPDLDRRLWELLADVDRESRRTNSFPLAVVGTHLEDAYRALGFARGEGGPSWFPSDVVGLGPGDES